MLWSCEGCELIYLCLYIILCVCVCVYIYCTWCVHFEFSLVDSDVMSGPRTKCIVQQALSAVSNVISPWLSSATRSHHLFSTFKLRLLSMHLQLHAGQTCILNISLQLHVTMVWQPAEVVLSVARVTFRWLGLCLGWKGQWICCVTRL